MGEALRVSREIAKKPRSKNWPSKANKLRQILPFELFLREIWPEDRTKNYMRLTGAKVGKAKLRISGRQPPPGYDEIVAILRSKHGLDFIEYVTGDEPPEWLRGFKRAKNIGDIRRRLAQQQRELSQLEMDIE